MVNSAGGFRFAQPTLQPLFDREIGFDIGSQGRDCRSEPVRYSRRGLAGLATPEASDVGAGVCALQDIAELPDPAVLPRRGIEKLFHKDEVVVETIARHELVGGEKPHSGAAAQMTGARSGKELLAFGMRAGRRYRQHSGDFAGVEIVAPKRNVTNALPPASTSVFVECARDRTGWVAGIAPQDASMRAAHAGSIFSDPRGSRKCRNRARSSGSRTDLQRRCVP